MPYPDEAHKKERFFCILSYLPKATVQAAIGSVPLAMGLPCGQIVLSVAVLGILITAPLGAILIDGTYKNYFANQKIRNNGTFSLILQKLFTFFLLFYHTFTQKPVY